MTKLRSIYDPKFLESYLNRRNSARLVWEVVGDRTSKIRLSKVFGHVQTSHLRFWLANRSYHQSQIGRTISHSWLYHQSWTSDCQISCIWSYNWSYPLTIGRVTSRRTSLWLNMHLRTTYTDWLHDLRRLMHDPTRSSANVRSFAWAVVRFTATGRQTKSLHAIKILYLTKHSRSVVCTSNRQKSHDQKIVRSGVAKALAGHPVMTRGGGGGPYPSVQPHICADITNLPLCNN